MEDVTGTRWGRMMVHPSASPNNFYRYFGKSKILRIPECRKNPGRIVRSFETSRSFDIAHQGKIFFDSRLAHRRPDHSAQKLTSHRDHEY